MLRCPTSELPNWPAGSPTANPDASTVVWGQVSQSRSIVGVFASAMALAGPSLAQPQPSITISTSGRSGAAALSVRTSGGIQASRQDCTQGRTARLQVTGDREAASGDGTE